MCTNQRWIVNKVTKERVLVNCGKCPACLQAKANQRTLRINLQSKFNVPNGYITFFVTLGYDNEHIPFILKKHYEEFINKERFSLPVYRLSEKGIFQGQKKSNKKYSRRYKYPFKRPLHTSVQIGEFENYSLHTNDDLFESSCDNFVDKFKLQYYLEDISVDKLPDIRKIFWNNGKREYKYIYDRVGVLFYKDIQDFIKRLRINLDRKYGIKDKFHFFSCGEYGPTSQRPHYHILFHFPSSIFKEFKSSVIDCWQFENLHDSKKQERQLKIADGAQNYVSSYVNCANYIHPFFQVFRPFRPSHTYSQGYGMLSKYCTLPALLAMAQERKFTYQRSICLHGVKSFVDLPVPSFVIRRYFPKFKGYSRLTSYEILDIIREPQRLCFYKKQLDYDDDDLHHIIIMLRNAFIRYCDYLSIPPNEYNLEVFAFDYVHVWNSYSSFINLLGYESIDSFSALLYRFVNWHEMKDLHEFVSIALKYVSDPVVDVNKYPPTLAKDSYLTELFHGYDKMKKVKNNLYCVNSNV